MRLEDLNAEQREFVDGYRDRIRKNFDAIENAQTDNADIEVEWAVFLGCSPSEAMTMMEDLELEEMADEVG